MWNNEDNGHINQLGLPDHNPKPRTERGKRRHEKRNDAQKKVAEKAWNTARSNPTNRFHQAAFISKDE